MLVNGPRYVAEAAMRGLLFSLRRSVDPDGWRTGNRFDRRIAAGLERAMADDYLLRHHDRARFDADLAQLHAATRDKPLDEDWFGRKPTTPTPGFPRRERPGAPPEPTTDPTPAIRALLDIVEHGDFDARSDALLELFTPPYGRQLSHWWMSVVEQQAREPIIRVLVAPEVTQRIHERVIAALSRTQVPLASWVPQLDDALLAPRPVDRDRYAAVLRLVCSIDADHAVMHVRRAIERAGDPPTERAEVLALLDVFGALGEEMAPVTLPWLLAIHKQWQATGGPANPMIALAKVGFADDQLPPAGWMEALADPNSRARWQHAKYMLTGCALSAAQLSQVMDVLLEPAAWDQLLEEAPADFPDGDPAMLRGLLKLVGSADDVDGFASGGAVVLARAMVRSKQIERHPMIGTLVQMLARDDAWGQNAAAVLHMFHRKRPEHPLHDVVQALTHDNPLVVARAATALQNSATGMLPHVRRASACLLAWLARDDSDDSATAEPTIVALIDLLGACGPHAADAVEPLQVALQRGGDIGEAATRALDAIRVHQPSAQSQPEGELEVRVVRRNGERLSLDDVCVALLTTGPRRGVSISTLLSFGPAAHTAANLALAIAESDEAARTWPRTADDIRFQARVLIRLRPTGSVPPSLVASWLQNADPDARLAAVNLVLAGGPPTDAMRLLLRRLAADPSALVRDRAAAALAAGR